MSSTYQRGMSTGRIIPRRGSFGRSRQRLWAVKCCQSNTNVRLCGKVKTRWLSQVEDSSENIIRSQRRQEMDSDESKYKVGTYRHKLRSGSACSSFRLGYRPCSWCCCCWWVEPRHGPGLRSFASYFWRPLVLTFSLTAGFCRSYKKLSW